MRDFAVACTRFSIDELGELLLQWRRCLPFTVEVPVRDERNMLYDLQICLRYLFFFSVFATKLQISYELFCL